MVAQFYSSYANIEVTTLWAFFFANFSLRLVSIFEFFFSWIMHPERIRIEYYSNERWNNRIEKFDECFSHLY